MNKRMISKDFYDAINADWIKKTKIPNHLSGYGSFYKIEDNIKKIKLDSLKKWSIDTSEIKHDSILLEMIKFYNIVKNWNIRKGKNIISIQKYIDEIINLKSWKDIEINYKRYQYSGYYLPINFFILNDFKDSRKQILWLEYSDPILPDKSYYSNEEKKKEFFDVWTNMVKKLLSKFNIKEEKIKKHIENAIKYDDLLSKYILSSEELAVYTNLYNLYSTTNLDKKINAFNIQKIANEITNNSVDNISVISPVFLDNVNNLINDQNFPLFKSRMLISLIISLARYLSNDLREIASEYSRYLRGIKQPLNKSKFEVDLTMEFYGMPFGLYYGKTYFGENAKKNVEQMVNNMINIYKSRLANNSWLTQETKNKAIHKLNELGIHVGYPNQIRPYYKNFIVKKYNDYNDLIENVLSFTYITNEWKFKQYNKENNKELWSMTPSTVNAYYSPNENQIVFPAAILQKPFYDIKQSTSANYGGIGSVIAHEISHAFDNNGANFDENGNMVNWWTDEDRKNFDIKTQEMISLFDGAKTEFGECNGKLTVSENIADAGGISCALEAAKLESDFDAKAFYINFATIWRIKYREEFSKLLLKSDVHAPAKLRTNIQVKNMDDFYKTFNIKENDNMFLPPEKRVKIW